MEHSDAPGEHRVHPVTHLHGRLGVVVADTAADGDDHGEEHERVGLILGLAEIGVGDVHEPPVEVVALGGGVRAVMAILVMRSVAVVGVRIGILDPGPRLGLPSDLLVRHHQCAVRATTARVILDHPRDHHGSRPTNASRIPIQPRYLSLPSRERGRALSTRSPADAGPRLGRRVRPSEELRRSHSITRARRVTMASPNASGVS